MAKRDIIILPDSRLRQPSTPVPRVDDEVRALIDDMFATMYDAPGIGLAAVQVGDMRRVVVADVVKDDAPPAPLALVNPEIVWASEELRLHQEGCLSIPEKFEDVERPARIGVRFLDREGAECEIEADGLLATCLQHEVDHLNGVLFIDHISKLKRDRILKFFQKQARLAERA